MAAVIGPSLMYLPSWEISSYVAVKESPDWISSTKSMSQPKMSASASAVWSCAPACADGFEQRAVDHAVDDALVRFERVFQHFGAEAFFVADHAQRFARAQLALEAEQRAVAMDEMECFAGTQLVEATLEARQVAQRGEVRKIELQAAKNAVERVVVTDDDFDSRCADGGRADEGGLLRDYVVRRRRGGACSRRSRLGSGATA